MASDSGLPLDAIRSVVAEMLGIAPADISDDDDLIGHGIDSIRIMQLLNGWRRSGVRLRFADLIVNPSLRAWSVLAAERAAAKPEPPPRPAVDESATFELAPMQQAYWIGRADGQVLGGVGAHFYAEFDGTGVDLVRLDQAARLLIGRHGMLRARFLGDGTQQIHPEGTWPGITVHDLPATAPVADALRRRLSHQRLAVEQGQVLDISVSRLPDGSTRTHINIDMLVSDALSYQIILAELAHFYLRPGAELPPIDYSFPRYLAEQRASRSADVPSARAYWNAALSSMPGAPQLPLRVDPERLVRGGISRRHGWLPPSIVGKLGERARASGVTLPVAFMTAFAEVIAAWSAEQRFLLNVPIFDREEFHPDVARLVGDFTNLVIVAIDAGTDLPFAARAALVQRQLRSDLAHVQYSGVEVLRDLARERPGSWMMAPVVFTSAIGMGELFGSAVRQCLGAPGFSTSETPQVWIDHQVIEHDGGLLLNWDVIDELFPPGVIDAMFGAYGSLISWLADGDWHEPLPSLLPAEQAQVRAVVNATGGPHKARLLHDGFFQHASSQPGRPALLWGEDQEITYAELAGRVLAVAGQLVADGLGSGELVGVCMSKGPEQVVAVLAVLAAGGCYLPLGADLPELRRQRICERAGVTAVLTELRQGAEPLSRPVPVSPDDLAYLIYTSGSTGEPKGVEITHRAAMNTIDEINDRFGVGPGDRVLAISALDFDLSVYDIFGLLAAGGAIVVVDEASRREARQWASLMRRHQVTVWNSVPALAEMMLVTAAAQGLRLALVSGDRIGLDLPARVRAQAPGCTFVALGGATEASIWSNAIEVSSVPEHWTSIPYGFPLRGQRYRVVDDRGRDCPDFVPGELWIGGAGVAEGYRSADERAASQFAWHAGERYYRTGDIGRYLPDGMLEFLGRSDFQVKIRGHRIELDEIEKVAATHPKVAAAAVTKVTGDRIGAAVVAGNVDRAGLRAFFAERLPGYMVPDALVVLGELPLSANGKIDRKALAGLIEASVASTATEEPAGPIEVWLAELWCKLLAVTEPSRHDSFLALGGDSLAATRLVVEIKRQFGTDMTLRQLFAGPTIADHAALIAASTADIEEGEL